LDQEIGRLIREIREAKGLSIASLARQIAFSPSHLRSVENGNRAATADLASACDKALGTDGLLTSLRTASEGGDDRELVAFLAEKIVTRSFPDAGFSRLSDKFALLQETFQRYPLDADRQELYRASAFLAGFVAQAVKNLGDVNQARRWWRTARYAADRSGDPSSALWVRGREIVHALGERPVMSVLRLIKEAEPFAATASPELVLEYLGGKAQALAIAGRRLEAEDALARLRDRFSAAPSSGYSGSLLSWGEERLHNTESFTYSRLGDDGKTESAQRAASAVYRNDPSNVRWPAGVKLSRASCLVLNGDVTEGVAHAREAIAALPAAQQTRHELIRGREVLNAIPQPDQSRPAVSEYREWLHSTFRVPAGTAGRAT
jgi:transcriptional regulator with XRE-family HTH domain